jgi:TonB family protein
MQTGTAKANRCEFGISSGWSALRRRPATVEACNRKVALINKNHARRGPMGCPVFGRLTLSMDLKIISAGFLTIVLFSTTPLVPAQAQVPKDFKGINTAASVPLRVGGDVTAPRAVYAPDPEFSEVARAAGYEGTCELSVTVDTDGKPRDITVVRKLGMQLDQKAIEALRTWTFEPAHRGGKPVAVQINVEFSFHIYRNGEIKRFSIEESDQTREARERVESQIYRASDSQTSTSCASDREASSGPVVTIAELNFEGALSMPSGNRDEIAASLKARTYSGDPDIIASEITERVKAALQNSGYLKAQVHSKARVLTSGPDKQRIAVGVQVDEGQQYRLEGIRFRNNRAISDVTVLRDQFPLKDGDVFNRAAIAKGLESLRSAYGTMGYINLTSVPEVQFNEQRQAVSLDIVLDEGRQFFLARVDVLGLDESVFQSSLKNMILKPGMVYNQSLIDLFLRKSSSLLPPEASTEPRFNLQLNEKEATVVMTYDFRRCHVD